MNQIGFCEWAFLHSCPSNVKFAAEVGAKCLQVDDLGSRAAYYPLNDRRLQQEYLELTAQYGISLVSVGANAAAKSGELVADLNGPRGADVKETLRKTVTACADMEIPLLMLPFFWDSMLDEKNPDLLKHAEKVLKYAGEIGADLGVTVTIESTLSAKRTIDLLSDIQSDWVRVFYDTQNTRYFCGADSLAEIRQYGDLIAQVHVKDGGPGLLGELPIGDGEGLCRDALAALKEIGYAGPLLLETHYDRVVFKNPSADLYALAREDLRRAAAMLNELN